MDLNIYLINRKHIEMQLYIYFRISFICLLFFFHFTFFQRKSSRVYDNLYSFPVLINWFIH